jgi:hypothetical protein
MLDVHPVHATVSGWRDFLVHRQLAHGVLMYDFVDPPAAQK